MVHAAHEGGQLWWWARERADPGLKGLLNLPPSGAAVIAQIGHPGMGERVGGVKGVEVAGQRCGIDVVTAGGRKQEVDETGELL